MVDKHYVNSTEWELVDMWRNVSRSEYDDNEWYSLIKFTFTFHRKPSYFVTTMILPCIILISIVAFSYFLPPGSGERMGVIITVLLAFAVFLEIVSSSLPQNSNSTSITSLYILASMSECAFSFLVTCIVIRLLHKGTKSSPPAPPPQWLRKYVRRRQISEKRQHHAHVYVQSHTAEDVEMQDDRVSPNIKYRGRRWLIEKTAAFAGPRHLEWKSPSTLLTSLQLEELCSINSQLKSITRRLKEAEGVDEVEMEWQGVAHLLDTFSFWGFIFTTGLIHGLLFLGYHKFY